MNRFLEWLWPAGLGTTFRIDASTCETSAHLRPKASWHGLHDLAETNALAVSQGHPGSIWQQACLPVAWLVLAGAMLTADYLTGPIIQFPVTYLLPVGLAAWFGRVGLAYLFAVAMPAARVGFTMIWDAPWSSLDAGVNGAIRIVVLLVVAYLTHRTASQTVALRREVRVLKGLLPICSFCKSIRDSEGAWHSLEGYVSSRSEAMFSHGLCPDCLEEYYGDVFREDIETQYDAKEGEGA